MAYMERLGYVLFSVLVAATLAATLVGRQIKNPEAVDSPSHPNAERRSS